jgi:hypothetical protein
MSILRAPQNPPQPSLKERVESIRVDLAAWLDARVEQEHSDLCAGGNGDCGIPRESLRQLLTRGTGCGCAIFLEHTAKDAT